MLGFIPLIAQQDGGGGSTVGLLLPLVLMGGIFYFLLIRPQQRRQRQQRELIQAVDIGDEVLTIGGIFGTVRRITDDEITIEVSPGVEMRLLKTAIARRLTFEDAVPDESDEEESGDQR
ncbi:MAG: preprotein translocase subunit YajC [Actinomycetota bacterium]